MKLGEAIYKSQQKDDAKKNAGQEKTNDKNQPKDKDNVVDADFEEVKEDKKDKDKETRA